MGWREAMTELKPLRKCWCFSNSSSKPKQPRLVKAFSLITGAGSGFVSTQNQSTEVELFPGSRKQNKTAGQLNRGVWLDEKGKKLLRKNFWEMTQPGRGSEHSASHPRAEQWCSLWPKLVRSIFLVTKAWKRDFQAKTGSSEFLRTVLIYFSEFCSGALQGGC